MSAPKYRIPAKVIASLHERRLTVQELARRIHSGRAHVSQVLANKPGRGYRTRRKLADHLLSTELALLGWDALGQPLSPTSSPWRCHDTAFGRVVYKPNLFHRERSKSAAK